MKNINSIKSLFVIFLSTIFSILVAEIVLNNFYVMVNSDISDLYQNDDYLGWKYVHGNHIILDPDRNKINITIDENGFRNNFDIFANTNKDKVLFIGDSVTAGLQVSDEKTFSSILVKINPNLQGINLGVNGFSSDQAYLVLEKYIEKINPSVVVYTFVMNDPEYNLKDRLKHNSYEWGKPYFSNNGELMLKKFSKKQIEQGLSSFAEFKKFSKKQTEQDLSSFAEFKKWLKDKSTLALLISNTKYELQLTFKTRDKEKKKQRSRCESWTNLDRFSRYDSTEWEARWSKTEMIIKKIKNLTDKKNSHLIITNNTHPFFVNEKLKQIGEGCAKLFDVDNFDINYQIDKISQIGKKLNINIIQPNFKNITKYINKNNCNLVFSKDGFLYNAHLSKCGHQYIAETLEKSISRLIY
ncbi:hypothetical protein ABXT72_04210 [Candidatus Pelagibacter sp. Uisw_094]|uniref:SGNH/GDSL hydrolase family protein n=1 Tax=Candidatus Pelagibacter sp. Uisw_094 TaxID=3230980 RepID=UPI0039ED9281